MLLDLQIYRIALIRVYTNAGQGVDLGKIWNVEETRREAIAISAVSAGRKCHTVAKLGKIRSRDIFLPWWVPS